jgi:carbonic anhydrase
MSRRGFVSRSLAAAVAVPLGGFALAACGSDSPSEVSEDLSGLTPDEALQKLKDGNTRFVAMNHETTNEGSARRIAVAAGQTPFAAVIGCVDSRVPPELVFDRGLGDLFVSRVAAAIADDSAVGSIEFGVAEFAIPLVVVLGHSKCGAVKATIEAVEANELTAPGQIGAVVGPIVPAVEAAGAAGASGDDLLDQSVRGSVQITAGVLRNSAVLSGLIADGKLKVVGAHYELATGEVTFLD